MSVADQSAHWNNVSSSWSFLGPPLKPSPEDIQVILEVFATALHSFAQPFIRYRLGDIATQGESTCNCGSPCQTIHSIEGRVYDRIVLRDGRAASPGDVLSRLEQDSDWVKQYQMVQECRDLVLLRLVSKTTPPPGDVEAIGGMMERFLGPGIAHWVDLLEAIPLAPGEKFRASSSKVFSNYGESTPGSPR